MTSPFMRAYTELLVKTCHRRGAHAIGGMAAFIPNRRKPEVTEAALAKVADDKRREAGDGFDGTWVAHPDLVATALAEFDAVLGDRPNQLERQRPEVARGSGPAARRVDRPADGITRAGLDTNISVGLRYLASWLSGTGAAAIDDLMEDAATAEISRAQVWQWVHHQVTLADGTPVTAELVRRLLDDAVEPLVERRRLPTPARARPGPADLRAGRPGRRLPALPDPARLRAAALNPRPALAHRLNPIANRPKGPFRPMTTPFDTAVAELERSGPPRPAGRASSAPTPPPTWSACAARSRSSTAWPGRAPSGCGTCSTHEDYVNALGAMTGGQAVEMVKAGLQAIYLSGWQVAADANLSEQVYPDQSLYAANSVPAVVRRINNALRRADQIEWAEARRAGATEHRHWMVPDRGRRRSRFRRRPQRLRADEGHDRGRAPPASTWRTSSPRRRSAATWAARSWCRPPSTSAPWPPPAWPPTSATFRPWSWPAPTPSAPPCSPATWTSGTASSAPASARPKASITCGRAWTSRSPGAWPTPRTPT